MTVKGESVSLLTLFLWRGLAKNVLLAGEPVPGRGEERVRGLSVMQYVESSVRCSSLLFRGLILQGGAAFGHFGLKSIPSVPRRVVLNNGVESVERNFVLADRLVEVNAGVLELVSPEYLTGQVGGPHLDVVPRLRRRSLHC